MTRAASVAAVAFLCAGLMTAPLAQAKPATYRFAIPGGELADQLNRFAVTTSIQVLYDPAILGRLKSKGLSGAFSKEDGARRLLQDTGLSWRFVDDNVLMIEAPRPVIPHPVIAPKPADETPKTVTVVGVRPGDKTAIAMKRQAAPQVEAVSAQDMAKYQDANLGDAIQRLASVSMSRSHGEGYQVTVRGFGPQFNNVLLDDNVMPSRNAGREFNFNDFSTDLVSSVVVYKTAPPSISSGGLGSTIDIRPADPFDYKDLFVSASVGTTFPMPSASLTVSNRFLGGKLGVLASVSRQSFDDEEHSVGIAAWKRDTAYNSDVVDDTANMTGHIYSPQNFAVGVTDFERRRINGRLVLQYRQSDQLEFKAYIQYADLLDTFTYSGINSWFTTFDPSTASVRTDSNGTVVDYFQKNALDFMASTSRARTVDSSTGATMKWKPRPDLAISLAINSVISKQNPDGEMEQLDTYVGYHDQTRFRLGEGARALPYIQNYDETGPLAAAAGGVVVSDYTDPSLPRAHVVASSAENTLDRIGEGRLRADWYHGDLRLSFGLGYMRRAKTVRYIDNTDVSCLFCGYPATPDLPDDLFTQTRLLPENFISGYRNNNLLPPRLIDYDATSLAAFLEDYSGVSFKPTEKPSGYRVREDTISAYWEAAFDTTLAGRPLHGLVGTRYETTSVVAAGNDRTLEGLQFTDITEEQPIYGDTVPVSSTSKYSYLLPSADLNWSLTDRMDVRLGLSRTLARPPMGELAPTLLITVTRPGNFGALQGNPSLKPYVSTNLDLAVEWPHGTNAFGSIALFVKNVDNFIVETATRRSINGVTDPATGSDFSAADPNDEAAQFLISEPVNGERALVWGEEFSWQRFFPSTGLGFIGNLTLVNTNKRFDPTDVDKTFAITGLSDSANIVGYYERGPVNLRATVTWRDEYLARIGQVLDLTEPTFINARMQVDMSGTYAVTTNLSVFGSVTNLTRSPTTSHGRFSNQFLSAISNDSRFLLGLRYRK